jgi:hypothetical protein
MLSNVEPAMRVREIATFLNVDEKTIDTLVTKGELPEFNVPSSCHFQCQDLEGLIKAKKLDTQNKRAFQ